ncbi:hypothetical protein DYB30_010564 [Aphanomyces astaci]|uniref:VASt domain-containing protein n=1 Tax=Aphanomyces astaci TaxID=112090 RepID=A0A396ZVD3_APHAT|nr:hypothetical protein DYB36_014323 [Aphanomyces astaci]RHY51129.1 hypothetical protein DYB30_010564 [Aphanomyces astaci]RHY74272.1 hypothetical protein DYB34_013670 [Aphanomyces astaci]
MVGETNVTVSQWADKPMAYTAFNRPETTLSAPAQSQPPKSTGTTIRRDLSLRYCTYTYAPGQRLVVSVTPSVHDAPFCDYFRAESRWVFDASLSSAHECSLVSGMRLNWAKSTFLKGQKPVHCQGQGPVAAAASEDGRKKDQDDVATMATTKKLDPDTSLRLLRRLNVVGVVVLVVPLLQLMATLYNLRTATNESIRLQKQHQVLLSQLIDKMKCVKSSA